MFKWQLLLLSLLVIVPTCWSVCESPECDSHCGYSIGDDGCAKCDCDANPYSGDCKAICPQDCGRTAAESGCYECHCGELWFNPETPPPPPGHDHH